jgi:hypothetical protein
MTSSLLNDALVQTQQWFNQVVLGLNLCPFAHVPAKHQRVRMAVLDGANEAELLTCLQREINDLRTEDPQTLETTLVIAPKGFEDFYYYNGVVAYLTHWLVAQGYDGFVQIASFHPQYQFAGVEPNDPQNLTNRSPFPIFHLIREASLSEIIDNGADTDAIPERNIACMQELSASEIRDLFPYIKNPT